MEKSSVIASASEAALSDVVPPSWLKHYLSKAELILIARAVENAETETTAEVVPMVVRSSINRSEVVWKILSMFLTFFFIFETPVLFTRDIFGDPIRGYMMQISELLVLFFVAFGLSRVDFICRNLSSGKNLSKGVWNHAELEFHRSGVTNTKDRNGILLFVSLLERQAVVLADRALSEKLDPGTWDRLLQELLTHIRKGDMAQGFQNAIKEAARIASTVCPPKPHDTNELSNRLRIKDGFDV